MPPTGVADQVTDWPVTGFDGVPEHVTDKQELAVVALDVPLQAEFKPVSVCVDLIRK